MTRLHEWGLNPEGHGVSRQFTWVVTALSFLISLTLLGALLLLGATHDLSAELSHRALVQIVTFDTTDMDTSTTRLHDALTRLPDVETARNVSQKERLRILSPWLGQDFLKEELPFLPPAIEIHLRPDANITRLRAQIADLSPNAILDIHAARATPLLKLLNFLQITALAATVTMTAILAIMVTLSVKAWIAQVQDTLGLLRLLGASDHMLMTQVAALNMRRAFIGSGVGVLLAALVFSGFIMLGKSAGMTAPSWHIWIPLALVPFTVAAFVRVLSVRSMRLMLKQLP